MKKFNEAQKTQLKELEYYTSNAFMELMKKNVHLIDNNELDILLDETIEAIEDGDCLEYNYDDNFYNVAIEYIYVNLEELDGYFNHYGLANLYMDNLGRGLVINMY